MTLKQLYSIVFAIFVIACNQQTSPKAPTLGETTEGEAIYLGVITHEHLNNDEFTPWFLPAHENFQVDETWVKQHKPLAKKMEFYLFMGTWCEDSQREVPGMIRLVEKLEREDDLHIFALDEFKQSAEGIEKKWNIEQVPTLIVMEGGEEINRIVEFPMDTLEEDLGIILRKEPYKHAYATD